MDLDMNAYKVHPGNLVDDDRKNEVLDFCVLANQAITDGYVVVYDSWW